jgi:hypothetical protein
MSIDGQTPGLYGAYQDPVLNPLYCGSLVVRKATGDPDAEILPVPPLGTIWVVVNANVSVEGAGVPSWSFREVVAGEVVRPVDVRTGTTPGSYLQSGALALRGSLRFQNTGATFVNYTATVLALPAALMQRFWLELTNVFQAVPIVAPAEGTLLRVPFGGFNQGTNSLLWSLNTDIAARTLEFRFTRGSTTIVVPNTSSVAANTRAVVSALGSNAFPPLMRGDVLEARVTAALGAPVYLGGLLQAVPQLSIA